MQPLAVTFTPTDAVELSPTSLVQERAKAIPRPLPQLDDTVIFFDDMETGPNGWTHASTHPNGIDLWSQSTARASSGVTSWRVMQHDFQGGDALRTPPIDLSGYLQAALSFSHWFRFDDCSGNPT